MRASIEENALQQRVGDWILGVLGSFEWRDFASRGLSWALLWLRESIDEKALWEGGTFSPHLHASEVEFEDLAIAGKPRVSSKFSGSPPNGLPHPYFSCPSIKNFVKAGMRAWRGVAVAMMATSKLLNLENEQRWNLGLQELRMSIVLLHQEKNMAKPKHEEVNVVVKIVKGLCGI